MAAMKLRPAAVLLPILLASAPADAATSSVVDLTVGGGTTRFLYVRPDGPATANVISISGGDGFLGIADDGTMNTVTSRCGPLTRNRTTVADAGIALALMDQPPNTEQVVAVEAWMRERNAVPAWVSGGSASTGAAAFHAANVPAAIPMGVLFFAPARLNAAEMTPITRPALVISHERDGGAFPTVVFNGLVNAVAKERIIVRGGTDTPPCGHHLFWDADAEFVAGVTGFIARNNAATGGAQPKYQALWYASPAES